jgi:hypothetical protein
LYVLFCIHVAAGSRSIEVALARSIGDAPEHDG